MLLSKQSITVMAATRVEFGHANNILQNTGGAPPGPRRMLRVWIPRHLRTDAARRAMDLARGLCRDGVVLPLGLGPLMAKHVQTRTQPQTIGCPPLTAKGLISPCFLVR